MNELKEQLYLSIKIQKQRLRILLCMLRKLETRKKHNEIRDILSKNYTAKINKKKRKVLVYSRRKQM